MNLQALTNLIKNDYNLGSKWELDNLLDAFRRTSTLSEVIKKAALAINPDAQIGTNHGHHGRVPLKVLENTRDNLIAQENDIANCKSFEELQKLVASVRETGFGSVALYDTTIRIGAKLELMPAKVFLYHGAVSGANTLKLKTSGIEEITSSFSSDYIDIEDLPAPLQALKPYHVENFLCVYENKKIGSKKALQFCL